MPVFQYKGMTSEGKSIAALIDAENARAARARLRRDGIYPTELSEAAGREIKISRSSGRIQMPALRRISNMDMALATRQLSTLVGSGIPLVEALSALTDQIENTRLKSVIGKVRERVNEGAALADAMQQTGSFSDLYISMVRAGEAGGALEKVLERLADYLESQVRLRNKVSSIVIYPAVMFCFALVVIGVLVTVVLPQITTLLQDLNQELPPLTRLVIGMSTFLQNYWWMLILSAIALFILFRAIVRTENGRETFDRFKLRLPVFGRMIRMLAISRFSRTLSTLLDGGIPIVRSLEIAKHVVNNVVLGGAIDRAQASITEGAPIAAPLRASGYFPPMVTYMIDVGERSGKLEEMLNKVSEIYEEQVETTVTRMTALLEPFLILLMVGVVIFIIGSTLLPMLQLTSSLG